MRQAEAGPAFPCVLLGPFRQYTPGCSSSKMEPWITSVQHRMQPAPCVPESAVSTGPSGIPASAGRPPKSGWRCATLHRGEEPPLVTGAGSGALFFSGCTLGCRDCQNWQLSREGVGRGVSAEELAEIMLHLETGGAANINFVTATQFIPSIVDALEIARSRGLEIPTVWNTSGFESASALDMLNPLDRYLPDGHQNPFLYSGNTRNRAGGLS